MRKHGFRLIHSEPTGQGKYRQTDTRKRFLSEATGTDEYAVPGFVVRSLKIRKNLYEFEKYPFLLLFPARPQIRFGAGQDHRRRIQSGL